MPKNVESGVALCRGSPEARISAAEHKLDDAWARLRNARAAGEALLQNAPSGTTPPRSENRQTPPPKRTDTSSEGRLITLTQQLTHEVQCVAQLLDRVGETPQNALDDMRDRLGTAQQAYEQLHVTVVRERAANVDLRELVARQASEIAALKEETARMKKRDDTRLLSPHSYGSPPLPSRRRADLPPLSPLHIGRPAEGPCFTINEPEDDIPLSLANVSRNNRHDSSPIEWQGSPEENNERLIRLGSAAVKYCESHYEASEMGSPRVAARRDPSAFGSPRHRADPGVAFSKTVAECLADADSVCNEGSFPLDEQVTAMKKLGIETSQCLTTVIAEGCLNKLLGAGGSPCFSDEHIAAIVRVLAPNPSDVRRSLLLVGWGSPELFAECSFGDLLWELLEADIGDAESLLDTLKRGITPFKMTDAVRVRLCDFLKWDLQFDTEVASSWESCALTASSASFTSKGTKSFTGTLPDTYPSRDSFRPR